MLQTLQVVFAGTPEFAVPALNAIAGKYSVCAVVCQPDRPFGRGRKIKPCAVKQAALELGLEVFQPDKLRDPDSVQRLRNYQPDIMVVAAYGQLLSNEVLQIPRFGCINIHASLLPRWRGAAPIQRAILAGDRVTGVTIMQMVRELDAGDIIQQSITPISVNTTAASLHDELAIQGASTVMQVLAALCERGKLPSSAQDPSLVTYAAKLVKSEAEIDWNETATEISRKVRAYNPVPVAFTFLGPKRLKIFQVSLLAERGTDNRPVGSLLVEDSSLIVTTGEGCLRLDEIQLEGARKMAAADMLRANTELPKFIGSLPQAQT